MLQGPGPGPLLFQGPSSDGAFLLTGRRAVLKGHARMGVARLLGPSGEMIRALTVGSAGCRRFSYSPGSLLRELELDGTPLREIVLVPRDLPGAAFQWSREEGGNPDPLALTVDWQPGDGLAVEPVHADGGAEAHVLARLLDAEGRPRAFVLAPQGQAWRLEARRGGERAQLVTTLEPDAPALLAVVEAVDSGSPPDIGLFDRLAGWERARAGDEARAEEEQLAAHVPGTELHQAVAWARARLECPTLDRPSSDCAWLGLAALCSGRFDLAREALRALAGALSHGEDGPVEAHRLLSQQAALWAGGPGRDTPEHPPEIPVPVGPAPGVLTRASLASRADPVQLARALCTLVVGTLGARPDAGFGRLRLAPFLPSHWSVLEVRNLPMGDVRVGLGYERSGGLHSFTLRQTAGSVPANLVFEPLVAESDVTAATVDGEPAELDIIRRRGRVGVRLQLPLDSKRSVALEGR